MDRFYIAFDNATHQHYEYVIEQVKLACQNQIANKIQSVPQQNPMEATDADSAVGITDFMRFANLQNPSTREKTRVGTVVPTLLSDIEVAAIPLGYCIGLFANLMLTCPDAAIEAVTTVAVGALKVGVSGGITGAATAAAAGDDSKVISLGAAGTALGAVFFGANAPVLC